MVGWRQAATLVVIALAVLAALALTGAVTADDGEEAATAPTTLQPTQVVAEIPEGYNELFPLQWGGGSLFQLKSRLATMGCTANTIWNYDGGEWRGYNQYNVPSTLNADWLAAYGEFVPAGSLYATCFDVCEFSYFDAPRGNQPCQSLAWLRASEFWDGLYHYPIDDSTNCTDDFDERVKRHVLPSMPLYPGVCIFRQKVENLSSVVVGGYASSPFVFLGTSRAIYPYYPSHVVVFIGTGASSLGPEHDTASYLEVEVHELCHTNQYFQNVEQMQPDRLITARSRGIGRVLWRTTKLGSSFIDMVGFTEDAAGDWSLPADSPFRDIFSPSPIELAAELCALYFLDRMGERSTYEWNEDFDLGRHLTDEIVEWIETWVALPAITAAEAD